MKQKFLSCMFVLPVILVGFVTFPLNKVQWESRFVSFSRDGSPVYHPDLKGNIIPDFSRVGYGAGDKPIPVLAVVKKISSTGTDNDETLIQSAIDELSKKPLDANGYRGAILLAKGTY